MILIRKQIIVSPDILPSLLNRYETKFQNQLMLSYHLMYGIFMTLNAYQVAICLQRIWVPFHAFSEADTRQSRNQGLQFAMLLGHLPCGYIFPVLGMFL